MWTRIIMVVFPDHCLTRIHYLRPMGRMCQNIARKLRLKPLLFLSLIHIYIATKKIEIETAKNSVEKYKSQQDNVRNNREYDVLTKEIEFQSLEIELCEKRIKEYTATEKAKNEEIAQSNEALEERKKDLDAKKAELEEIVSETKQEEEKLREKAKVLETTIEPRLLQAFKRIRKNSRNGLGIVYVQRDACGGCFNKIPPQKQLDIRMRKKIIVCEYCGRIMIDPELAGVVSVSYTHLDVYKRQLSRTCCIVFTNPASSRLPDA